MARRSAQRVKRRTTNGQSQHVGQLTVEDGVDDNERASSIAAAAADADAGGWLV